MNDCDKARLHYIHKRVKCCPECHEFMVEDDWAGYTLKLPDNENIGVCHTVFQGVPDSITLAD
jgi:RNA polymerase subunit RPABC4/transcription elongation factor Spt4